MMKIKELLAKNNYLLGKIFGGCSVVAILLIIIAMVFMKGDENRVEKITSSTQVANQTIAESSQEQTTLKNGDAEETTVDVGSQPTEELIESSAEETTLAAEVESFEEATTKTVADSGKETSSEKETTVKKEDNTTKKKETTVAKQTTKQTSNETTTVKKQSTTQQETTTEEQTTEKKETKIRLKDSEEELLSFFVGRRYYVGFALGGRIYDSFEDGFYRPFLEQKALGWENIVVCGPHSAYEDNDYNNNDYFANTYGISSYEGRERRGMSWGIKYNDAIINECYAWVENPEKFGMKNEFGDYLTSLYTDAGSKSMFSSDVSVNASGNIEDTYEGMKKEWCEKWCYFDTYLQKYRTKFYRYKRIYSDTYTVDGYLDEIYDVECYLTYDVFEKYFGADPLFHFYRWIYDEENDKTTVYIVVGK